ncbi:MAG: hypothetical protein ACJAWO_001519, partial [Halieaceae bacterium]
MRKLTLLITLLFHIHTSASDFKRHVILPGMVLQEGTLDPLKNADIEVWLDDSLITQYESNELGLFNIIISRVDTYDVVVKLGGFHTQIHAGLIIESFKPKSSLDIYMTPIKEDPVDIHCGERCWCVNYEKHNWEKDTLVVLKGSIMDKETREPIPFANILIKKDGLIVRVGQTDFDGHFKIDSIPADSCKFQFSSFGSVGLIVVQLNLKQAEVWHVDVLLERYSNYRGFSCGWHGPPINWAGPTIDLFLEEQEINAVIDADLPSTKFEESILEPGLSAYPNPIIDLVTVTEIPQIDQFKILNHMGREILTVLTDFQKVITVDVSLLTRGLYFIEYQEAGKTKLYG